VLPRAPSPPPAPVNVFDFLVQNGDDEWESDASADDDDDDMHAEYVAQAAYVTNGYGYGSHPEPSSFENHDKVPDLQSRNVADLETPYPRRSHARNISTDSGTKKSGKRKRTHPDDLDLTKTDIVMTDVPAPLHHSGLTGGLNRLMTTRNGLPPSPDESPNSPIKRSRREGREKTRRKSDESAEKGDRKRTKTRREEKPLAKSTKQNIKRKILAPPNRKRSPSPAQSPSRKKPALKAIEYPSDSKPDDSMALVRISHAPTTKPVTSFLNCLAKGTDSEEGVSVWKALKRWRRDGGKEGGEKELWKGIKIRMNDRGELIICV
jgi:cell growth-regulating nucleolar protein